MQKFQAMRELLRIFKSTPPFIKQPKHKLAPSPSVLAPHPTPFTQHKSPPPHPQPPITILKIDLEILEQQLTEHYLTLGRYYYTILTRPAPKSKQLPPKILAAQNHIQMLKKAVRAKKLQLKSLTS